MISGRDIARGLGAIVAGAVLLATVPVGSSSRGGIDITLAAGLIAVGAVAWCMTRWRAGGAAILAGGALGLVTGGEMTNASPLFIALALAAAPLIAPLLALVLTRATAAWLALAGGIAAGPVHALLYDPFLDPGCTKRCLASPLALLESPTWAGDLRRSGILIAALSITTLVVRPRRRWQIAVIAAAAWSLVLERAEDLAFVAAGVALLVLAVEIVDALEVRRRMTALTRSLTGSGDVEDALRRELEDDDLTIAYWLDQEQRFVRSDGSPGTPPRADQEGTEIRAGGELVARVCHSPRAVVTELAAAVDGSARLALDNERLAAQVAVQVAHLRDSRARIIARSDAERRLIERDVHDGAQQHVLALGLELTVALGSLAPGDPHRLEIEQAMAETTAVLDELRDLSHGLYPASLEAGGLSHGLRTLAGGSARPVRLETVPPGRLSESLERAAFTVVADAAGRASGALDVAVRIDDGELLVRVDGAPAPREVVADRIAAAGGSLEVTTDRIVASFPVAPDPCAS